MEREPENYPNKLSHLGLPYPSESKAAEFGAYVANIVKAGGFQKTPLLPSVVPCTVDGMVESKLIGYGLHLIMRLEYSAQRARSYLEFRGVSERTKEKVKKYLTDIRCPN